MNYTEKYHLPQWEENDRVLREDFNQAMARLEDGLGGGAAAFYEGIFRQAYNHYHLVQSMESQPRQVGHFYQPFSGYGLQYSRMLKLDNFVWLGNGETAPNAANFRDTISQSGRLETNGTLQIYFTPDRVGRLQEITLTGSIEGQGINGQTLSCNAVLKETGGSVESQTSKGSLKLPYGQTTGNFTISGLNLIVHGGEGYRLELTMETENWIVLRAEVMPEMENCMKFQEVQMPSGWTAASAAVGEECGGGLLLVHCKMWGEGADLELDWDGEILKPSRSRLYAANHVYSMRELEFWRTTPVPEKTNFRLNINCRKDGEFGIYDWGMMAI